MSAPVEPDRSVDFGPRMKRLREERGIALRDIADITKISVRALDALERNEVSRLPGGIFSRALIRAYAEQIGVDPETTVREFVARFPHDAVGEGSPYASAPDGQRNKTFPMRRLFLAATFVLLVAVIGAAVLLVQQ